MADDTTVEEKFMEGLPRMAFPPVRKGTKDVRDLVPEPDLSLESKWNTKLNSVMKENIEKGLLTDEDKEKVEIALDYAKNSKTMRDDLDRKYAGRPKPGVIPVLPDFGNIQMSDEQIEGSVLGIITLATRKKLIPKVPQREV